MKKVLLMFLAGLMAMGASVKVYADARIDSMATDVREVEDLDLIWLYPNKVLEYKNTVDFRLNTDGLNTSLGAGNGEWGGVIADEASLGGVVGVYVNRPAVLPNVASSLLIAPVFKDPLGYYFQTYMNNDVDLFWAQAMGDGSFGVHLNYGDNGVPFGTDLIPQQQADNIGLGLGLGLANVGPFGQLNIHADYDMESLTYLPDVGGVKNKDNGIYTIKIGALGQTDVNDTNFIRAFADVYMDQFNTTDLDGVNDSDWDVTLGVSCSHKVNSGKGLVSTGLLFNTGSATDKTTLGGNTSEVDGSVWEILWNGSVESQVADWLTLRTGIEKALASRIYQNAFAPTYINGVTNNNVAFDTGFGVTWQNFVLNGVVKAESGVNPGNGIFYAPSAAGSSFLTVTEADLAYKF